MEYTTLGNGHWSFGGNHHRILQLGQTSSLEPGKEEKMISLGFIKGALFGLFFGIVNFWLLSRIVEGMLRRGQVRAWKTGVYFILKMTFLIVTIGLILWKGYVTPLAFSVGFTISLVGGIIKKARETKTKSQNNN